MLPLDLLRATTRRGHMTPLFCSADPGGADAQAASKLIAAFAASAEGAAADAAPLDGKAGGGGGRRGRGKDGGKAAAGTGKAATRAGLLEAAAVLEQAHDHRLVRGLFAILERRTEFVAPRSPVAPQTARRRLFEESAARGLALSAGARRTIVASVAKGMGIGAAELEEAMWNDSEDRMLVRRFRPIGVGGLAALYNRSLAQTLLFRCASMDVRVRGGVHWKRVLREVKRRRLMYVLEPARGPGGEARAEVAGCRIEGPTSLFRMTDRYGTAMARVLPAVAASPGWEISGTIVRHVDDEAGARLYRFALSDRAHGKLLHMPASAGGQGGGGEWEWDGARGGGGGGPPQYDSSVEERFAAAFESHFGPLGSGGGGSGSAARGRRQKPSSRDHLGWRLVREPDPLIAGGRAMIPDFAFERFGRRVYLEIVGFWTRDYLRKKSEKVAALLGGGGGSGGAPPVDLLVAVDSGLACSQGALDVGRRGRSASGRIFAFSGDVPLKPVLERLAAVDAEIIDEKTGGQGAAGADGAADDWIAGSAGDPADAHEFAAVLGAPVEAAARVLSGRLPGHTLVAGRYLVSAEKAAAVGAAVGAGGSLADVCVILEDHGIPASCHGDMLSAIGYDVAWRDLDPSHALVSRRRRRRRGA